MLFKGTDLQQVANKSYRSNAQYSEYRQQYCVIIIKFAKRLDLNYSNHWKQMIIIWHDRGANYHYNGNHKIYKCTKSTCTP